VTTFSDWASLFGYLCLFLASLAGFYFLLPGPRRDDEGDPRAAFRRPTKAKPKGVEALAAEADAHERYAPGHARRVADLALALADAVAFPGPERARLERAALLHDVGELELPAELLAKPGLLSQAELHRVWTHPALGARKALEATGDEAVATWVRWSHERWDGLGYPDGLAGEQIPLPARILRLADSAEAMTQARPYRPAMAPEEAIAEINRLAGISYDPELARVFVDYVLPRALGGGTAR
jgi:HD-GYP domain-containing protein (c-di-GMP phosphodiesterase class II)